MAGSDDLGWRAGLPTELQDHDWLKDFTKVGDFATAAIDLKGQLSKAVTPPGESATDDERSAYYKALGVPESVDGYNFDLSKIPEDLELNEEVAVWLKQAALNSKLMPGQAQAMLVAMASRVTDGLKQQKVKDEEAKKKQEEQDTENRKKATEAIKGQWGNDTVKRIDRAQETALKLFGEDYKTHFDNTGKGNDLYVLQMLDILAQVQIPDTFLKGEQIKSNQARRTGLSYPWMREFYGIPSE